MRFTSSSTIVYRTFGLAIMLIMMGCTQKPPELVRAGNLEQSDTHSGEIGRSVGPDEGTDESISDGFTDPATACVRSSPRTETAQVSPSATRGANIVFLIDDSGSMYDEIQKVINEIQRFISRIQSASGNNYRMILLFHKDANALRGRTFLDPQGNPINDSNPFYNQIDNQKIFYVESETWSKWADIALFRAFGKPDMQIPRPTPMPADNPPSGYTIWTPELCAGAGTFYRPRHAISNFNNTQPCFTQSAMRADIDDLLLPNITANVVLLSDDDLNVNFDRANYDRVDPTKNAYPEPTWNMMRSILNETPGQNRPLIYHSIVGLEKVSGNGIEEVGTAHMALSKRSGGGVHDLRASNYNQIFDLLTESIIFSERSVELTCEVNSQISPSISFDGQVLPSSAYTANPGEKTIRFLPSAFTGRNPSTPISVSISY